MGDFIEFGVYSPSRGRAKVCRTHLICDSVVYVVDKSEAKEYRKRHDKVMVVPDGVQVSKIKVMNGYWIIVRRRMF